MESTNLHHHLQDQPPPPNSLSSTPSCYGTGSTHSWTPYITLNAAGNNFNPNLQEAANPGSSRSLRHNKNDSNMIQGLGYHHWTSSTDAESLSSSSNNNQLQSSTHYNLDSSSQFSKSTKEEGISFGFPKFSEMLNTPSSMILKNNNNEQNKDVNALMLKTLFSGDNLYSTTSSADQNYPNFGSQIYPTINISNLKNQNQSNCTALDMSMQSLDLLSQQHSQQDHHGLLGRFNNTDNLSFGLHGHMQQHHPTDRSSCSSNTPSLFTNGTAETKRPCTLMESNASQSQTALKKSRSESRPSCPPFKVRKEKLGDRIAALQQLVAPFGKTDTASVLMEAIGYIKFLQGQVETLSVPYMKPSQNQTNTRVMQMQGGSATGIGDANGEPKQDLRSRGLCLVPLSCMSYIAGDGGSEVWQRPNFGAPT